MKWRMDPGQIEVVDEDVAKVLRRKTPAQRVAIIGSLHRTARLMLEASVKREHPNWSDAEIKREAVNRLLNGTT